MKVRIAFVLKNKRYFDDIKEWGVNCDSAIAMEDTIRQRFGYSHATVRVDLLRSFLAAYDRLFSRAQGMTPKIVEPEIKGAIPIESVKKRRGRPVAEPKPAGQIDYEKVAMSVKKTEPVPVEIDKNKVFEVASRDIRVRKIYQFLEGDADARVCR